MTLLISEDTHTHTPLTQVTFLFDIFPTYSIFQEKKSLFTIHHMYEPEKGFNHS